VNFARLPELLKSQPQSQADRCQRGLVRGRPEANRNPADFDGVISAMKADVGAFVLLDDTVLIDNAPAIGKLALKHDLPSIGFPSFAEADGLLGYGIDFADSKIGHVDIKPGFDLAKLAGDGRIATGDVTTVPVGLYAKAALEKLGVWPSVEPKMAMTANVRAPLAYVARGAPLGIVYATDAKIEPSVKVVGVFPDNSHDPIVYPVAATVNAKPGTMQYLAFLRSAATKAMFEGYGFSVLVKPTS
jgi:hypothetical protein